MGCDVVDNRRVALPSAAGQVDAAALVLASVAVTQQNLAPQSAPDLSKIKLSVLFSVVTAMVCHTCPKSMIAIVYLSGTSTVQSQ